MKLSPQEWQRRQTQRVMIIWRQIEHVMMRPRFDVSRRRNFDDVDLIIPFLLFFFAQNVTDGEGQVGTLGGAVRALLHHFAD